jgi:SAM-dependent methyltransferase
MISAGGVRLLMDINTIHHLNAINREFYRITAGEFDQTRGQAWPGWLRLAPLLGGVDSVLDVGCGNGRFGVFLAERLARPLRYHGVDSSPALLDAARTALAAHPRLDVTLETRDIVEQPPDSGAYSLVALFGVIHHVPGAQQRRDLLRALAARVAPGGLLAFTAWRFIELERFAARVVPWDAVDPALAAAVEPHDYLLDWRRGASALRYCHYVDDAEHAALAAATGLTPVLDFRADGENAALNRYSLLRRV